MAPGNVIFDETKEIRALQWPNEAVQEKGTVRCSKFLDLPILYTSSLSRSMYTTMSCSILESRNHEKLKLDTADF